MNADEIALRIAEKLDMSQHVVWLMLTLTPIYRLYFNPETGELDG